MARLMGVGPGQNRISSASTGSFAPTGNIPGRSSPLNYKPTGSPTYNPFPPPSQTGISNTVNQAGGRLAPQTNGGIPINPSTPGELPPYVPKVPGGNDNFIPLSDRLRGSSGTPRAIEGAGPSPASVNPLSSPASILPEPASSLPSAASGLGGAGRGLLPSLGRAAGIGGKVLGGAGTAAALADQLGKLAKDLPHLGNEWGKFLKDPTHYKYVDPSDPNYDEKRRQLDAADPNDPRFDPKHQTPPKGTFPPGQPLGDPGKIYYVIPFANYSLNGHPNGTGSKAYLVVAPFNSPVLVTDGQGKTAYFSGTYAETGQSFTDIFASILFSSPGLDLSLGDLYVEPRDGGAMPQPYYPPMFDFDPGILIVPGTNDQPANQKADEKALSPANQPPTLPKNAPVPNPLDQPFPFPSEFPGISPGSIPSPNINPFPSPDPSSPDFAPGQAPDANPVQAPTPTFSPVPTTSPGSGTLPGPKPTPQNAVKSDPSPNDVPRTTNKQTGTLNPLPPVIPPQLPTPGTCEDPCIQGLHDKFDESNKKAEIYVKVFKECNGKDVIFEIKIVSVPVSEVDSYKLLYERLFNLESQQCSPCNAIAAVPDWWQVRTGADRSQAVIVYANFVNGKRGISRWSLCVPHYNPIYQHNLQFPQYTKGSYFGTLTLIDNSKLTVNAQSEVEAESVIRQFIPFIKSEMLPKDTQDLDIHTGRRKGKALTVTDVVPVAIHFFSTGQRDLMPDWVIDL